nr:AI-2E family transporter [Aurantimonas aggregata]
MISLTVPYAPAIQTKVLAYFDRDGRAEITDAVGAIAGRFRVYLVITTGTSLLTGIASAAWSYSVGLELALIWGILNFLLNFVPVVGNLVGIVPPVLYAVIQFDGATMPLVVLAGFAIIQVTISNFVYPALQGGGVSMPAIVIVIGLLFWSWLWGFAGALLAVPLTAAFVIASQHFASTRWIADLATQDQSKAPAPNSDG